MLSNPSCVIPKSKTKISSTPHQEVIDSEINWFETIIESTLQSTEEQPFLYIDPPELKNAEGAYAELVKKHDLNSDERLLLMLAFSIHRKPELIRKFNFEDNRASLHIQPYQNIGAPTAETFLWLVCGSDLKARMEKDYLFDSNHLFFRENLLSLEHSGQYMGRYHGVLNMENDYIDLFMYNEYRIPQFSPEFPAVHAKTEYDIMEITMPKDMRSRLLEIRAAIEFEDYMRHDLAYGKDMTPGYLALFYGPPGTGKSLTAATLGKLLDMQVFEVDVSNLVSKYIGETTKNLDKLFRKASGKNWVLVFNEADALFSKRSEAKSSDDAGATHANQTISYLLEAIPRHKGVIILTTNMRHNFDKAFGRRINSEIHFKPLTPHQAGIYTKKYIHSKLPLEKEVDLEAVYKRHCQNISIASIHNIVHRLSRITLMVGNNKMKVAELERCVQDEVYKSNN